MLEIKHSHLDLKFSGGFVTQPKHRVWMWKVRGYPLVSGEAWTEHQSASLESWGKDGSWVTHQGRTITAVIQRWPPETPPLSLKISLRASLLSAWAEHRHSLLIIQERDGERVPTVCMHETASETHCCWITDAFRLFGAVVKIKNVINSALYPQISAQNLAASARRLKDRLEMDLSGLA